MSTQTFSWRSEEVASFVTTVASWQFKSPRGSKLALWQNNKVSGITMHPLQLLAANIVFAKITNTNNTATQKQWGDLSGSLTSINVKSSWQLVHYSTDKGSNFLLQIEGFINNVCWYPWTECLGRMSLKSVTFSIKKILMTGAQLLSHFTVFN